MLRRPTRAIITLLLERAWATAPRAPGESRLSVHLPNDSRLQERLTEPGTTLVICLCADWCRSCHEYREHFEEFAKRLPPNHVAAWLDIEDHADWLNDDIDIEDFPTVWVGQAQGVAFFGTMLPHIGQLERLVQRAAEPDWPQQKGPDLYAALQYGPANDP